MSIEPSLEQYLCEHEDQLQPKQKNFFFVLILNWVAMVTRPIQKNLHPDMQRCQVLLEKRLRWLNTRQNQDISSCFLTTQDQEVEFDDCVMIETRDNLAIGLNVTIGFERQSILLVEALGMVKSTTFSVHDPISEEDWELETRCFPYLTSYFSNMLMSFVEARNIEYRRSQWQSRLSRIEEITEQQRQILNGGKFTGLNLEQQAQYSTLAKELISAQSVDDELRITNHDTELMSYRASKILEIVRDYSSKCTFQEIELLSKKLPVVELL